MKHLGRLAACLAIASLGCADADTGSGMGRTRVYLTDAPFPFDSIARVDLYVASIEASTALDTAQDGGAGWVTVAEPRRAFNLLDFQQGTSALAGEADIPAGRYRAIRLTINTALSHVIGIGGGEVAVRWPVQGELALNAWVEHALDVTSSGTQIVIDIDVGRTFQPSGQAGFFFIPWIRAINEAAAGSIAGTVTGPDVEGNPTPVPNALVVVATAPFPGAAPAMVSTGRTDDAGRYVVGFLPAATYNVSVQAPPYFAYNVGSVPVQVAARARTSADFSLTRDSGSGGGPDTTVVTPGGPVASVVLRVGTPSGSSAVATCDSVPMAADLRNAQGQILLGRTVSWATSDSSVLALRGAFGQYAVLRALRAGAATLGAVSEGISASLAFTVTGAACAGGGGSARPVATVTIQPSAVTMSLALDSAGAYATPRDSGGAALSGRTVTWSVADSSIVTIQPFGQSVLLRAKKVGTTTITASSEGKSGSAMVNVN